MIKIKPVLESENAEEIKALYYFLLYKTLPFPAIPPSSYLPKDDKGNHFYYENGNPSSPQKYPGLPRKNPEKPRKTIFPHASTEKFLEKYNAIIHDYCKTKSKDFPNGKPETLEEMINLASTKLHDFLYSSGKISDGLTKLLFAVPNEEALKTDYHFELNHDLIDAAGSECAKDFRDGLYELLYTEVFNYDKFSKQELFPRLIQLLNVGVCPYCNRAFTTTVQKRDGTYHRQNQVDHYVPKALYPWFALSLNNFIPSCANCNHKKSDSDNLVLYPYEEGFGSAYHFHSVPISGVGYLIGQASSEDEFEIEIEPSPYAADRKLDYHERVENSRSLFGLDELYRNSHNSFVAGIYEQRYIFGDAYIQSLQDSFGEMFRYETDIRKLLYLRDIDENAWDESPLAKLTHDIDEEITRLSR